VASKVLLLEEDATYAQELSRGLSVAGCDVTLLRDGKAGFERATTEGFDVLVVSAELPGVNGFRLCARLRKNPKTKATPIVLMGSGRTVGFDEHQKLPSRANGYMQKPVDVAELVAMLERLRSPQTVPPPIPTKPTRKPPPLPRPSFVAKLDAADIQGAAVAALRGQVAALESQLAELRAKKSRPPAHEVSAKTELSLREQIHKKESELVAVQTALEAEKVAAIELRKSLATAEAQLKKQTADLREKEASAARAERAAQAAQTDKEQARKRAEDAAKRLEKHTLEIERLKKEASTQKSDKGDLDRLRAELAKAEKQLVELRDTHQKLQQHARELESMASSAQSKSLSERAGLVEKLEKAVRAADDAQAARVEAEARLAHELSTLRAQAEKTQAKLGEELRKLRASEQELRAALDRKAEDLTRAEEQYSRHVNDLLHEQRSGGQDLGAKLTEARAERDAAVAEAAKKLDGIKAELISARAARAVAEQRTAELNKVNADLVMRLDAEAERAFQLAEDARTSSHRTLAETDLQRSQFAADLAKLEQQLAGSLKTSADLDKQLSEMRMERDRVAMLAGKDKVAAEARERALTEKLREIEARSTHAEESLKSAVEQVREAASLRSTLDLMREQHAQELDAAAKDRKAAMDASHAQQLAGLEQQNAELQKAVARSRESLDAERRHRLVEDAETMKEMDALEASVAAKDEEIARLTKDLARETSAAKAALDQLEADRTLIAQAKTLLSEMVARHDEDD
jgi:DNA-binding response OmpR family regulator